MLGMVERLLHEPGERLRTFFFNFCSNKSNEIRIAGVHAFKSSNAITNRHSERSRGTPWNQMAQDSLNSLSSAQDDPALRCNTSTLQLASFTLSVGVFLLDCLRVPFISETEFHIFK